VRHGILLFPALLSACTRGGVEDHGPAPAADHEAAVRAVMDRVLGERYELDGLPSYRFAAPVQDRVARWHFEPEVPGKAHSFGDVRGWRVDFWVTPRYVGYPPQPESRRMAFFGAGRLRGIFSPGRGTRRWRWTGGRRRGSTRTGSPVGAMRSASRRVPADGSSGGTQPFPTRARRPSMITAGILGDRRGQWPGITATAARC